MPLRNPDQPCRRRRNVLGSRFRTKLVFIFLVIVLIPSVVLFYAAVRLIAEVNENLFAAPLEEITGDSKALMDRYLRTLREDCARAASRIAAEATERELLDADRSAELTGRGRTWLDDEGLDFVAVFRIGDARPALSVYAPSFIEPRGLDRASLGGSTDELIRSLLLKEQPAHRLDVAGEVQVASAAAPVRSSATRELIGAVVARRFVQQETAVRTARINKAYQDYRRALSQRPNLKRVYTTLFGTLTLLVLFAASWTGFYLARQITVPIQALAEGTKEITAGNLEHRVTATAGDEIGFLIESFNRMTDELRGNRRAIETSRAQLQATNLEQEERRLYIEQLLENVPAGVVSLDASGKVATMNRAAYQILGLPQDRPVEGLPVREALGRDDLHPLVDEIDVLPGGEAVSHVRGSAHGRGSP